MTTNNTVDIGLSVEDARVLRDFLSTSDKRPYRATLSRVESTVALILAKHDHQVNWPTEPCTHGRYGCEASTIDHRGIRVHPKV
jgi:hypothetical protein